MRYSQGDFNGRVKRMGNRPKRKASRQRMNAHIEQYAERLNKEAEKPRIMRKSDRPDQKGLAS